jgi:NAD(P)-dependent dehydrogenase (short-subunit alcohol dehydrogenase family)
MTIETAVVTGAARGIGHAVVRRFADAGATVFALDVNAEALASAWGKAENVSTHVVDIRDGPSVERCVGQIARSSPTVDVLVNNAGVGVRKPFFELDLAEWQRVIQTNLAGTFHLSRSLWPILRKPDGVIINLSSIHGERPLPGMAAYSASKGGINALTAAMALDAAPYGVRVVGIAPGFVHTEAWDTWKDRLSPDVAATVDSDVADAVPLGRQATPDEITQMIEWCAGDSAKYLTGTTIVIDGGVTARAYDLRLGRH